MKNVTHLPKRAQAAFTLVSVVVLATIGLIAYQISPRRQIEADRPAVTPEVKLIFTSMILPTAGQLQIEGIKTIQQGKIILRSPLIKQATFEVHSSLLSSVSVSRDENELELLLINAQLPQATVGVLTLPPKDGDQPITLSGQATLNGESYQLTPITF